MSQVAFPGIEMLKFNNTYYLSALRSLACFAVIVLHIAAFYIDSLGQDNGNWKIANAMNAACRWCVPVFVMISGAMLLNKLPEETSQFYLKRAQRVLVPLIVWALFYSVVNKVVCGTSVHRLIAQTLLGYPYYHLWYLFMVMGLYLVTPFISRALPHVSSGMILIGAMGLLLWGFAETQLSAHLMRGGSGSAFSKWIFFLPYFMLGYVYSCKMRLNNKWIYLLGYMAASLGIALGNAYLPPDIKRLWGPYSYLNPLVVLQSCCVLLGVKQWLEVKEGSQIKARFLWVENLGALTFGIYLVHAIIIDVFRWNADLMSYSAFAIPLLAALVFIVSMVISYVLSKTPFVCKCIGF